MTKTKGQRRHSSSHLWTTNTLSPHSLATRSDMQMHSSVLLAMMQMVFIDPGGDLKNQDCANLG